MSTDDELFTPAEVLGGFSAKRARLLLFQIESRTAYLMMQSRRTIAQAKSSKIWRRCAPVFYWSTLRPMLRSLSGWSH